MGEDTGWREKTEERGGCRASGRIVELSEKWRRPTHVRKYTITFSSPIRKRLSFVLIGTLICMQATLRIYKGLCDSLGSPPSSCIRITWLLPLADGVEDILTRPLM